MKYEYETGLRYTRAAKRAGARRGFVSFISALSVASIALGVAALIAVLSVMNGFEKDVRDRMLSVISHIELLAGRTPLKDWQPVVEMAKKNPHIVAAAPFVAGQVMLTYDDTVRGVLVRGIDPSLEGQVASFAARFEAGSPQDLVGSPSAIAIGLEMARQLKLKLGDELTLVAPRSAPSSQVRQEGQIPSLSPSFRRFKIVGIFKSSHLEYDNNLVLMSLAEAASFFRIEGVSGVRLLTNDVTQAPQIADALSKTLVGDLYIRDWSSENRNWFLSILIQKRLMFIILSTIMAVAVFNLVTMLVMTVTDKRADIAILRTLGATPFSVMKIFITQGACLGLVGCLIGTALGVFIALNVGAVVAWVEGMLGLQVLAKGVYFIDYLPSDLRWLDVVKVAATAFALALLSTIYPSWSASRIRPAEALRYE